MKLWGPTGIDESASLDGFVDADSISPADITDEMIIRALHVCDGLITAVIGYLRGRHGIWVSRPWLVRRIETRPMIKEISDGFSVVRREICEEVVFASVKAGSVKSAMWYLEHVHPDVFGGNRMSSDAIGGGSGNIQEVAITAPMDAETWLKTFTGMRHGGRPN